MDIDSGIMNRKYAIAIPESFQNDSGINPDWFRNQSGLIPESIAIKSSILAYNYICSIEMYHIVSPESIQIDSGINPFWFRNQSRMIPESIHFDSGINQIDSGIPPFPDKHWFWFRIDSDSVEIDSDSVDWKYNSTPCPI